jgi:hypothetical protein
MRKKGSFFKIILTVSVKCILLFGLIILPSFLFAQTPERGKVEIDKDSKVDSLIGNYLVSGKTGPANPAVAGGNYTSDGFRVQIFSGSDRKAAYSIQAKFQDKHPEVHTYLSYREPNFKVHVGDYRSRLEAEKMVDELKNSFTGVFIINEKINASKLDTE